MSIQTPAEGIREGQRIAKLMARAGLCSRRDAEQWIADGRVTVNGEVLTSPAFNVSDADEVRVDDAPLKALERTRLFLFHKPRGLVTTAKDPEGRQTIFDALPPDLPRVVAVGRLDINTEGLLLLTNDGGLSRILELPSTGWLRRYRVRAHGDVNQAQLDALRDGVTIEGVNYLGIEARFERQQGSNVWITMGLREGKNREIKRVLEHMGLSVNRLIRVSFGPFELGDLAEGDVMEVRTRVLRDQLGPKLAKAANANFDAPIEVDEPPPPPIPRGDQPLRRPRDRDEAPAPRHETPPPRKRKHVSVLRAEAREEAAGPRRRVVRGATADRKGREIKIERISTVRAPEPAREERPRVRAQDGAVREGRDAQQSSPRAERPRPSYSREAKPREGFARGAARGGADQGRETRPGAGRPARGRIDERRARPEGSLERPRSSYSREDKPRERFAAGPRPSREGRPSQGHAERGRNDERRTGPEGASSYSREAKPREGFDRAAGARPSREARPSAGRPDRARNTERRTGPEGGRPSYSHEDKPRDGFARSPRASADEGRRFDARRPAGSGYAGRNGPSAARDEKPRGDRSDFTPREAKPRFGRKPFGSGDAPSGGPRGGFGSKPAKSRDGEARRPERRGEKDGAASAPRFPRGGASEGRGPARSGGGRPAPRDPKGPRGGGKPRKPRG